MTIDAAIPLAAYTVAAGASYPLSWPYGAGTIRVAVETDAGWTDLAEAQFTVSPAASDSGGSLVLDPAAAAVHAGRTVHIRRVTPREQGWTGLAGSREKGVEVALDQQVLALQELAAEALRTLRVAGPAVPPAVLGEGDTVMWDGSRFVPGPDAENIARAEEIAAQAAADAASAAASAATAQAIAGAFQAYAFASRAEAEATTIPAPQLTMTVVHNGLRLMYRSDSSSTAIFTNGGTVAWGPDPAYSAFLQHYGVTTYPSIAEALAAGAAMASGERAAEQARLSAACGETGGDLVIRGFVEVYDKLILNSARSVRLARDPARDGLVVSSRFNLAASAIVQGGTLVSDGAQIDSLHIWADQPENPANRSALTAYPKAVDISGITRGRIGLLRLSAVRDGLVGIGNCGGWEIGRLEIGAFGRALHLDGALDQVSVQQVHCWRYGFVSNALLQAVQEDGDAEAMRLGRMDGLCIDAALVYRTKVVIDDASGDGLRIDITSLRLDGDGANLILGRGKSEIGLNYGTELLSAPQQPYKLLCTAGEHVVEGADLVSDAQATVKVTGGHLTVRGKIFNSNLTIGQGAVVEGGTLVMDATRLAWPAGARAVPFVQQSGSGVLRMLDCVVEAETAGEAVRFGTDQPGNYIDLAGIGKHIVTAPSGAHRGMYGRSQRADMVARCADGWRAVAGQSYTVDGLDYVGAAGATAIADLPGLLPQVFVSPDHFGGKGRSHIEQAWAYWNGLCATNMNSDVPAQTALPFVFVASRYNYDSTGPLNLPTAGSRQRAEWRAGAICRGVQIRLRNRWCELIDPYIIGGPYDMEFGIAYQPDEGLGLRGAYLLNPKVIGIQNAGKTAGGLKVYGNATHLSVIGGRLEESDYNLWFDNRESGDSVSGVLMTGTHLMSARVNNIFGGSISESKLNNLRVRGAAQEGILLRPTSAGESVLELYMTDCSVTGNHTDLSTRASYAISGILDNAGKARLVVDLPSDHFLWAGLRGLTIGGTGITAYDGSRKPGITAITSTGVGNIAHVDIDLDFDGDATGTLYHCGWDVRFEGVEPGGTPLVGRVNDIQLTGGNINSIGVFYCYNINFGNTRLKVNALARGCNRIQRIGGLRGRAEQVSDEPISGAWSDVPIVGQTSGINEFGAAVGAAATRDTVPTLVMRAARNSTGLSHNRPVAYNSVGVNSETGVTLDGPVTATDTLTVTGAATIGGDATIAGRSIASDRATLDALATAAQVAPLVAATWVALSGLTGAAVGAAAEVLDTDTGTHTDPVIGGTVANAGRYSWSASPAGWRWIGVTGLAGKAPIANPVFTGSYGIGTSRTEAGTDYAFLIADGAGNYIAGVTEDGTPFGFAPDGDNVFDGLVEATGFVAGDVTLTPDDDYLWGVFDAAGNGVAGIGADGATFGIGTDEAPAPLVELNDASGLSWWPENCLLIFPVMGQSNADAVNNDTGDAIISGSAVYPTRALMPLGGRRYSSTTAGNLVPLVEAASGGRRESLCSGFANNLIAIVQAAMGYQPRIYTFTSALTGATIEALNRGSVQYNNMLDAIRDGVTYARANGLIPIVIGAGWVQGEADSTAQKETYRRALIRLAREFADDAMALTGQTETPIFFAAQTRSGAGTAAPTFGSTWYENGAGIGTYEADGSHLVRCVGPLYYLPISSDGLHLACAGQYGSGVQFARAVWGEFGKQGWHPIRCVGGTFVTTTKLRLEYNVPDNDALVIRDSAEVTDTTATKKGYYVTDRFGAAVTISTVTIPTSPAPSINNRFVDLDFATAPSAPVTVYYAQVRDASADGPVTGARGCLATSTAYTDLTSTARRHWAPSHTIKVN